MPTERLEKRESKELDEICARAHRKHPRVLSPPPEKDISHTLKLIATDKRIETVRNLRKGDRRG